LCEILILSISRCFSTGPGGALSFETVAASPTNPETIHLAMGNPGWMKREDISVIGISVSRSGFSIESSSVAGYLVEVLTELVLTELVVTLVLDDDELLEEDVIVGYFVANLKGCERALCYC